VHRARVDQVRGPELLYLAQPLERTGIDDRQFVAGEIEVAVDCVVFTGSS
jgi:hypothetical protein